VGRIAGAFGLDGGLKVDVLTDFPERFHPGSRLYLRGEPVTVQHARDVAGDRMIVKLREVPDRTEAEALRGATLDIREEDLAPLPEGSYYRFQLVDLEAWTDQGERLGSVTDIIPTGGNDVFVITGSQYGEVLAPNRPEIVEIDLEAKRLTVHIVPGLLPETGSKKPDRPRRTRR
jgi:16S rRNA processing protein RimM